MHIYKKFSAPSFLFFSIEEKKQQQLKQWLKVSFIHSFITESLRLNRKSRSLFISIARLSNEQNKCEWVVVKCEKKWIFILNYIKKSLLQTLFNQWSSIIDCFIEMFKYDKWFLIVSTNVFQIDKPIRVSYYVDHKSTSFLSEI